MQHANLTAERWSQFSLGQQLLMIANEMNRAARFYGPPDRSSLQLSLERVLNLVDATVSATTRPGLRRELLRWRDLVAREYIAAEPDRTRHLVNFRALLMLHPDTYLQVRAGLLD
ncbi:MAG: hypothetical protein SGI90_02215 [Candidatus Eisenbacteria bacterium]|nr:hypothetical protein [Candidatus Eisenbacteria bacterium]